MQDKQRVKGSVFRIGRWMQTCKCQKASGWLYLLDLHKGGADWVTLASGDESAADCFRKVSDAFFV
jgi:hypothetical protein